MSAQYITIDIFHAHAGLEGSSVEVSGPGSVAPAPVPALGGGAAGVRVEARNVVIEADGGPHVETFELPVPPPETGVAGVGAFPPTAAVVAPWGEVTTDDLGEQILQGVLARGSRETHTIPAGAIADPHRLLVWLGADRPSLSVRGPEELAARRDAMTAILRQWIAHV